MLTMVASTPDCGLTTLPLVTEVRPILPEIGAIVLECANLPPYAKFVHEAVNRPVFDFLTLTNMVYSAVVKREFTGLM